MGRTVIADDKLQAYVQGLLSTNTWQLGLIIGKLTTQKDYVIHMVRTPEPVEDQASDDDDDDDDSYDDTVDKTQKKPSSLESMNELWAATHAKQVTTMLTGGLSVIGIFALAPPNMMQNAQAKLRQVLFAMHKQEKKSQLFSATDITDRILLQICSSTRKSTCRSIDVSDPKSAFRPADWKYTPISDRWTKLVCDVSLKVPINIPAKSTASIAKQIQTGLQPFYNSIEASLILVDNNFRDETEMLELSTDKKHTDKKSKGKDRNVIQQVHQCRVLSKMSVDSEVTPEDPKLTTCCTEVVIKGAIHSRGFVTSKPTVQDAIKSGDSEITPEDPKLTTCCTEVVIKGAIHGRGFITGKPTVQDAIKSGDSEFTQEDPKLTTCSTEVVIKGAIHSRGFVTGKPTVQDAIKSGDSEVTPEDPKLTTCSTEVVIKGAIHSRGFVTGKPTVQDAIKSIKQDITRSISSRCELLCDDLQLVEEDTERQEVYSTPRRVFFTLPGTSIDLCDYMFQDEKVSEVTKRIKELLDITVAEEDLDLSCEQPATEEDCSIYKQGDDLEEIVPEEIVQSAKHVKYYLMAGISGLVGILAAGFTYILSENT